jgi:hypothetical protein
MRSALFWDFAQRRTEVSGKRIVPVFKGPYSVLQLKVRPIGFFETSVGKYRFTLRKHPPPHPKERTSPLRHVFNDNAHTIFFLYASHKNSECFYMQLCPVCGFSARMEMKVCK